MKKLFTIALLVFITSNTLIAGGNYKTTKDGYIAAVSEESLDKAIDLMAANDYEALQKLMDSGLVFWLKSGLRVQIVDSTWTGKIKIRPKGTLIEVWTVMEAVE